MRTYFRQSGDTIFRYANEQDYVFFIHNIDVDQSFTSFRSLHLEWPSWNCTEELPLKVVSDEETEHSGVTLREWILQDMDPYFNQPNGNTHTYKFIEGIGLQHDFIYLTPDHVENTYNESGNLSECLGGAAHLGSGALYHYHDLETNIDFALCDFTVSIDDLEFSPSSLLLFPNPAKDRVHVKLNGDDHGPIQVSVFDLRGMVCQTHVQQAAEAPMPLKGLSPGLYLVTVETSHRVFTRKLVIE